MRLCTVERYSLVYCLGKNSSDKFLMSTLHILISFADSQLAVRPGILNPWGKKRLCLRSQPACVIVAYTKQAPTWAVSTGSHPHGSVTTDRIICQLSREHVSSTNDLTQFLFIFLLLASTLHFCPHKNSP